MNVPVFLIHGEKDQMFPYQVHFEANKKSLEHNPMTFYWLVKDSLHSKMYLSPQYPKKLSEFLEYLEKSHEGEVKIKH